MKTLSAIPIRSPFIDEILAGTKTWEIRSKFTKKIGPVALIRSGSGTVVGLAEIVEVIEITPQLAKKNYRLMGIDLQDAYSYTGLYAWVLGNVVKLKQPVPYKHPSGAITWVTLDEPTTENVFAEASK